MAGRSAGSPTLHFVASLPIAPFTANVPYPNMIEYHVGANPFFENLLKAPIIIKNGETTLPSGPGLGIEVDFDAVAAYEMK